MKIGQKVKTKHRKRIGTITEIIAHEKFLTEVVVDFEDGIQKLFYESELEVIHVQSK